MTTASSTVSAAPGPTDPSGVTGVLATWLAELEHTDIPARIRERAAHLLLDGIACALVGAQLPWSRRAVAAVTRLEGIGNSPMLGWKATLPAPAACLLNSTFIQGFELDDYHPGAPLHSLSLVLPSALATVSGAETRSGQDFLTGIIAGMEVGPRVGLALHGGEMLSRGWHSGAVFGTHASTATAGWLRKLTAGQFEDALGLAATQSGGLMAAQYEAMSKRMHHGFAARSGFYAAGFAQSGYTGIKRVFEREYGGFLSTFGENHDPDPSQITAGLGDVWQTENIAVKAYAAMAGTHAPIDCAHLARQQGIGSQDVAAIDVWVSHAVYHHGWWETERPLETIGAQMNVGYAVAVALLDGNVLAAQFTRDRIASDDVWALIDKIAVHHDPSFEAQPNGLLRARMVITTHDGRHIETAVDGPRGGATRPLTNVDIAAKGQQLAADLMGTDDWAQIETLTLGIDDLDDVADLTNLITRQMPPLPVGL
jgi:2-methylcitrate dehydratase PrpD